MAAFLKNTANVLAGLSLVRLLSADLKAELQNSPYGAAGLAAAAGVLTGFVLARRHTHRTIPTRF